VSWLQASFRGAPFEVEDHGRSGGPRFIIHEFPGRSDADAEANGQHAPRFSIEAHVIGDDYLAKLARLEEALNQETPGELVHPSRGTLLVVPDGPYSVHENTRELGKAKISITFAVVGPPATPVVQVETSAAVKASAAAVLTRMKAQKLDVSGPDFLAAAARALLAGPKGVITTLSKVNNQINAAFGLVDDVSATILDFSDEIGTLIRTPETLALKLQNLFNSVMVAIGAVGVDLNRGDLQRNRARVASTLSALTALGTVGDGFSPVTGTTTTRDQERQNQAELIDLSETAGVVEGIKSLSDLPLDNTVQAGDLFVTVSELVDRLLTRGTLDDGVSQALRGLRAQFLAHLRRTTADLTGLGRYTPRVTMPALLIAYELYGDSARDQELIERNVTIEHPGFVQGGVTIAVADA
jgi:prophage DNA circulation protein